ncbi:MAG: clostripain-related cysteine peptidase [Spirochaetota bacterium]|nr:clostripain-related cysteine peptidase [Spirochaetota bacterium]
MKKLFLDFTKYMCLFPLILIITLSSCGGGGDNDSATPKPGWTIMVYMAADNDLSLYVNYDLNEMAYGIKDNSNVTIIALCDKDNSNDTKLYKIKHNDSNFTFSSEQLFDATLGVTSNSSELNMGDPQTLSNFIDFCKNNYPADNYALILWNHGGGWRNKMPRRISVNDIDTIKQLIVSKKYNQSSKSLSSLFIQKTTSPVKAVCWDETSGDDPLTMAEVKQAVNGKGLTLIGFDACLMGMVEVAYQLKDCAQYMVASEEIIPAFGWAYDYMLEHFYASSQTPVDLGKAIINGYIESYEGSGEAVTLSLVDLTKMDALANAIDTLSNSLISQSNKNSITAARHKTLSFYVPHYIDVYHFAQNASSFAGATQVMEAVNNAVLYHRYLDDTGEFGFDNSHGLSIYFPLAIDSKYGCYDDEYPDYTSINIDFATKNWKFFINSFYANTQYYTIETFQNTHYNDDADTYIVLFYKFKDYLIYLDENDDIDFDNDNFYSRIRFPLGPGINYYILSLDIGDTRYYSIIANETGSGYPDESLYPENNEGLEEFDKALQIFYNTTANLCLNYEDDCDWMFINDIPTN